MRRLNALTQVVLILAIIGALNWGLIGFFNWNLVNAVFGGSTSMTASVISRIIYSLVGLCGLALLVLLPRLREFSARPATTVERRAEVRA